MGGCIYDPGTRRRGATGERNVKLSASTWHFRQLPGEDHREPGAGRRVGEVREGVGPGHSSICGDDSTRLQSWRFPQRPPQVGNWLDSLIKLRKELLLSVSG